MGDEVTLVSPEGDATTVSAAQADALRLKGYHDDTEEAAIERTGRQAVAAQRSAVGAAVAHGADSLLFGLPSLANEDTRIQLEQYAETHPTASLGGSIAGAFLPGMFGDEAGLLNLGRDPVAVEHAASSLSSKFLYGGEVAGEAGSAGRSVERGLAKASKEIDSAKAVAALPEDLTRMDAAGLRAAREGELDQLAATHVTDRAAAKSAAVDDVIAYQAKFKEANPYLATGEGSASAPFAKSSKTLRNAMDDVEGLRESPGYLLKPLRQQAQALEKTIAEREAIASKLDKVNTRMASDLGSELAALPEEATHIELTGKTAKRYAAYADAKLPRGAPLSVAREDAQGFIDAIGRGEVTGASQQALNNLDGLLQANRDLQTKIKTAATAALPRSELTSARLTSIDAARDALATPKARSLGEEMLGGSVMGHVAGAFSGLPIIGPMLGAKAGQIAKDLVFGRMGKAAASAGERTKAAVGKFLDVAKRSAPTTVPRATQVLANVAFAPKSNAEHKTLPELYKVRSQEIRQRTAYGPDGSPQMRPEAREAMASKLAPIRAVSPIMADKLETLGARRLEFLSSKLPRRPDIGGIPIGPDHWQPSDMEMRTFARYVSAVEDPHGIEERLADGTITPEDAEAYHAVYPDRAAALQQQILLGLPMLSKSLPYQRRLALSIFSGVPVDPAMHPQILAVLQGSFTAEPGSEGGTMAPKAQPQFGSVSKSAATETPSQRRAEGTR